MMQTHLPGSSEVGLMVSAFPVPVLVADYTPIIERFFGMDGDLVRERLLADDALLTECLTLPRAVAASPEWIRLYGAPHSPDAPDLRERHFSSITYPALRETLIQQFTAPFYGITSIVREHTAPTLFGQVTVRSHWKALIDADQPLWDRIVIVDLDVTDLRSAQHDLERTLDAKEQLVASKDQLIASVSHEIRTPLSSIVGFARLLYDSSGLTQADRHEMMGLLVQQSADLTNIVDDLLVAAKADMGQLQVTTVSVDMRAQAAQALESLDPGSRKVVRLSNDTVRCAGDPARVRQIVRNLISNALRYGGPQITVNVETLPGVGSLVVVDDGPGIPEELRPRVFDAYTRGDQPLGLAPSLGLGLHISRTLAELMRGSLTYSYENGESIFELRLPLDHSTPPTA
jgi:signal transduction histidine kinase